MDPGKEVAGKFIVSGCDAPEVLESAEGALDDVSPFVCSLAEAMQSHSVGFVGNDGLGAALDDFGPKVITVIPSIGEKRLHRRRKREHARTDGDVGGLTLREKKDVRLAGRIAQRMDFCRAPTARAADRLAAFPPFPPAAERCALTDVLSSDNVTLSLSLLTNAVNIAVQRPRLAQRLNRL